MLGNLIGGFIVIVIGTALLPAIANSVHAALDNNGTATNVTGAAYTVTNLVTLFYALGLMTTGVAIAVSGLRQAGIM
jgi:hypothetical protein